MTQENDFKPRHGLDQAKLSELFQWSEEQFLERTQGSPIRRAGFEGWQRNLAIGLGNGPATKGVIQALENQRAKSAPMVVEHIDWALDQLSKRKSQQIPVTALPLADHLGHKLKHLY